jgi:dUTP pyrophosphatase
MKLPLIDSRVEVRVKRLNHGAGLPLPDYATRGAAGMDICAAESLILRIGKRHAVATGFVFAIPDGYEMQVRPRSGLALMHGVTCLNSPGTIDSDYRGEVRVILANLGEDDFQITKGDRIAQIVVAPVTHASMLEVEQIDETVRGTGGFGSTGV